MLFLRIGDSFRPSRNPLHEFLAEKVRDLVCHTGAIFWVQMKILSHQSLGLGQELGINSDAVIAMEVEIGILV